jgi:hypothetical protein
MSRSIFPRSTANVVTGDNVATSLNINSPFESGAGKMASARMNDALRPSPSEFVQSLPGRKVKYSHNGDKQRAC